MPCWTAVKAGVRLRVLLKVWELYQIPAYGHDLDQTPLAHTIVLQPVGDQSCLTELGGVGHYADPAPEVL